jgi:hypothetical protein
MTKCSCPADRLWAYSSSISGKGKVFLISKLRGARNVVFSVLGDLPASEFYVLFLLTPLMKTEQSVPKRRHVKFKRRGINQKKEHNKSEVVCRHAMMVCGGNGVIVPFIRNRSTT